MANYRVTDTQLTAIANAIRTKGGTSAALEWPSGFISAVNALPSGGGGVTIVSWASGSDADVAAMIDAAQAGTIDLQQDGGWAVGDVRTIHIDAFTGYEGFSHDAQDIDIVITSFDNYMNCGNVMQFDFKDSLATEQRMNSSRTNVGGYGASGTKTTTLPALVNALPVWLKSRLIEFSVYSSAGNSSQTIETVTGNKLALRSEVEIFGSTTFSISGEGSQIDYYSNTDNRKKKRGHDGVLSGWWERSPVLSSSQEFCYVLSNGSASGMRASNQTGIAPFGCL